MIRKKLVDFSKIQKSLQIFENIPIQFLNIELDKSLEIAYKAKIYCYDAYLLRCAQKLNAPLLSLDKKLIKIANNIAVKVIEVV